MFHGTPEHASSLSPRGSSHPPDKLGLHPPDVEARWRDALECIDAAVKKSAELLGDEDEFTERCVETAGHFRAVLARDPKLAVAVRLRRQNDTASRSTPSSLSRISPELDGTRKDDPAS
mmetsp:Transcript_68445/g.160903  ORF Transcript_68445/g.160903 Transcript_68445/m.160903 type:complete len:119 (+) Transcript_68445:2-358(+)